MTPSEILKALQQNLIHNRMNFKLYGRKHWTFAMELRNRLFYGEFLKYYPRANTYGDLLETDPGSVDMSWELDRRPEFGGTYHN